MSRSTVRDGAGRLLAEFKGRRGSPYPRVVGCRGGAAFDDLPADWPSDAALVARWLTNPAPKLAVGARLEPVGFFANATAAPGPGGACAPGLSGARCGGRLACPPPRGQQIKTLQIATIGPDNVSHIIIGGTFGVRVFSGRAAK